MKTKIDYKKLLKVRKFQIIKTLLFQTHIDQWRIVFGLSSIITIATYFVFQIYGTADIQKWNNLPATENLNDGDYSLEEEGSHMLKKPKDDKIIPKTY